MWSGEGGETGTVRQAEALVTKPDDLGAVPRTHMAVGGN